MFWSMPIQRLSALIRRSTMALVGVLLAMPFTTVQSQTQDAPPAGYVFCAAERSQCSFSGTATVVYGARTSWSAPKSYVSTVACNNASFGVDPLPFVAKSCYYRPVETDAPPAGYARCAGEGAQCSLTGTADVIFGAGTRWTAPRTLSGAVTCRSSTFGADPAPNVVKSCYSRTAVADVPPSGYTRCASEGAQCAFTGTANVVYGARTNWTAPRSFSNALTCRNATFGVDPAPNVAKSCYYMAVAVPGQGPTTQVDAARLLTQATYGPTMAEIQRVANMGASAWINEQFTTPSMDTHWDYALVRRGPPGCTVCNSAYVNAVMESFWLQAVRGPDQLRQRTVLALSEIFVVSGVNSPLDGIVDAHASYLDMLSRNAFGNYRQLLEQVATHPSMGHYLSHFRSEKEDPTTGRLPDENFAREVMQLFTIGLWQLNPDGTRRLDGGGNPIPTYGQSDVSGLAKVFTGLGWGGPDTSESRWNGYVEDTWRMQMQSYPAHHSQSEKRFLGVTIPANTSGSASLRIALDTLFNHPNVGPFFGRQLIQRMVTSNPSPAYVGRVAAAFNNNGSGVRGDMRAVLRAVLLDPEARDATAASQPTFGKLREPMVRFGNWMRAFNATSQRGVYQIWNLEDNVSSLGQNPMRAPSVFNWFRPDYAPPGEVMARNLVAPEFQITHETTATGYANFITWTVRDGFGWNDTAILGNYSAEIALANNPSSLLDRLNLLLTSGRMSASTRQTILDAVNAIPASQAATRVHTAVALTMISSDFIVQK